MMNLKVVSKEIVTKIKFFNLLGLAMRAGKVVLGQNMVLSSINKKPIYLAIIAQDATDNTIKKISNKCTTHKVKHIHYGTKDQLGQSVGKDSLAVLGISDSNFAKKLQEISLLNER